MLALVESHLQLLVDPLTTADATDVEQLLADAGVWGATAGAVVPAARRRGWTVLSSDPGRLTRIDPAVGIHPLSRASRSVLVGLRGRHKINDWAAGDTSVTGCPSAPLTRGPGRGGGADLTVGWTRAATTPAAHGADSARAPEPARAQGNVREFSGGDSTSLANTRP